MKRPWQAALFLVPLLLLLAGCDEKKTVTIHYRPLANTYKIVSNGKTATAEEGIFRIYRVHRIYNGEADAQPFTFEASKLFVRKPNKAEVLHLEKGPNEPYSVQSASLLVPPHTTADHLGFYVVVYDSQAPEANDEWVPLRYDNSGGESILMVQDPPSPKPTFKPAMTGADLPVQPLDQ